MLCKANINCTERGITSILWDNQIQLLYVKKRDNNKKLALMTLSIMSKVGESLLDSKVFLKATQHMANNV